MATYNMIVDSVQKQTQSSPNVIYIDDTPSTDDVVHVTLDWLTDALGNLVLTYTGDPKADYQSQNYHFSLTFAAGDLANPTGIIIAPESAEDWDIQVTSDKRYIKIYCLSKSNAPLTLAPGSDCSLTLQNAAATTSDPDTRTALIAFTFNTKWVKDAQPDDLSHVSFLVTYEPTTQAQGGGSPYPPLAVNLDTTNMVLRDGTSQNYLVLRIANQGQTDIALDQSKTSILLSFDMSDDTTDRWALATEGQVSAFYVPGLPNSSGQDPNWPGYSDWNIGHPTGPESAYQWQVNPSSNGTLKVGEALEIPISNIVTGHATGRALMHVQVQGLSGYTDQTFAVEIQKTPLFYGNTKVGIGTTQPSTELSVNGWGTISGRLGIGSMSVPTDPLKISTSNKSTGWSHDDGTVNLLTYIDDDSGACLGTYSNHPLHFFTNNNTNAPQLTLATDGKFGIGTASPASPLQIRTGDGVGLSHTNGHVDLATCTDGSGGHLLTQSNHPLHFRTNSTSNSQPQLTLTTDGKLGIGTTSPAERLHVNGNLQVDGTMTFNPPPGVQGLTINGQPAMQIQTWTFGPYSVSGDDAGVYNTGYSSSDWIAISCTPDAGLGSFASTYVQDGSWFVYFGFNFGPGVTVHIMILFIRRELVSVVGQLPSGS